MEETTAALGASEKQVSATYEQPFVKENTITIDQLIKTRIAKLGENISVSRFARFKVGDANPSPVVSAGNS